MKVAIMQPYFFPYIGYFTLIKHTDRFILFDTVQFIRHGWIERNRILKQDSGWLYIQVPIKKSFGRETIIKDIVIDNTQSWQQKILSQLITYKKLAPNYHEVIKLLQNLFSNEFTDIVSLNKASLELVCDYLDISHDLHVFSKMNLQIIKPQSPDEWALNICTALVGVDEYWNLPGGIDIFDRSKYLSSELDIKFVRTRLDEYKQNRSSFEPGLSIIDIMMFKSPEEIRKMLDVYDFL
jgi:hypothetical protein